MNSKGLTTKEDKFSYLNSKILVKYDKPHSCYHFMTLIEDL